jgi:hypothetical protein
MVMGIKEILMEKYGLCEKGAEEIIQEARDELDERLMDPDEDIFYLAEDICEEFFGLEPDYMEEILLDFI